MLSLMPPPLMSFVPWFAKMGELLRALATMLDGPGLMLVAVADSSFLSIPEGNDFLIVIFSSGKTWSRMAYYVGMTTAGSIVGCTLLYLVGRRGGSPLLRRRFSARNVERAERLFKKYGLLTVVVPSMLPPPCPFKIFVLSAGIFRLGLHEFLIAVAIGRTIRYAMWGILAVLYGSTVKIYMQRNLPTVGVGLSAIFLLALAAILGFYIHRTRQAKR